MIETILSVVLAIATMAGVVALSIWIIKACDSCKHSYERIDDYNDRKMILVCRRCGKIKKLRK
jgi:Flp pilus assembly protein CpaB